MNNNLLMDYKDGVIVFNRNLDGSIHGEYWTFVDGVDDREDFYIYQYGDVCVTDCIVQGIYMGSVVTDNIYEILNILDRGEGWEDNLIQLTKRE